MATVPLLALLVEDDPSHARLLLRAADATDVPARVAHVQSGEEALNYVQGEGRFAEPNRPRTPHVLLLDIWMPGMDGFEVLRRIRDRWSPSELPVVIVTTSSDSYDIERAYDHGANGYMVKPSDYSQLARWMRGVLQFCKS